MIDEDYWKRRALLSNAKAEKKMVAYSCDGVTREATEADIFYRAQWCRIAPEPNLRPWTAEEVPHLARIREKGPNVDRSFYSTILAVKNDSEVMCLNGWYKTSRLLEQCEHSTDGGKTWLPCGVLEDSK